MEPLLPTSPPCPSHPAEDLPQGGGETTKRGRWGAWGRALSLESWSRVGGNCGPGTRVGGVGGRGAVRRGRGMRTWGCGGLRGDVRGSRGGRSGALGSYGRASVSGSGESGASGRGRRGGVLGRGRAGGGSVLRGGGRCLSERSPPWSDPGHTGCVGGATEASCGAAGYWGGGGKPLALRGSAV